MSGWANAWDALCKTIGAARDDGKTSGYFEEQDHLTIDQRLKAAEVAALLSIAEEISALNPQNVTVNGEDGITRNGWGFEVHK